MTSWELLVIAVGLSMDAFAVALCTGLSMKKIKARDMWTVGLYFGGFQALMPLIGFLVGKGFADKITAFAPWVAFGLLALVGGKMIKESTEKEHTEKGHPETQGGPNLTMRKMLPLAIATSIDALAVGVTFALEQVSIGLAVLLIGVVTLAISMAGIRLGRLLGARWKSRAELAGGIILVAMGLKILLEHLGVL